MTKLTKLFLLTVFCAGSMLCPAGYSAAEKKNSGSKLAKIKHELKTGLQYKRILIIEALGRDGSKKAGELIIEAMLRDRFQPVRRAAQRVLADSEDPRIYPAILEALDDPKRRVRLAAIDALSLARSSEAAEALVRTANKHAKDKELVRLCLEALRILVYRIEPEPGFEAGLHQFVEHRDSRIRLTAVTILGILGRYESLPCLIKAWKKSNKKMKIRLADAFANIGRVEPVDLLIKALEVRKKRLVIHSLYALAQIQSFTALEKIHSLARRNKDARVDIACLYAMIEIPDKDSIPVVMQMLGSRDPSVLHWAIYALGELEAKSARPDLELKLSHKFSLVRASAATVLGELGISPSKGILVKLVSDPEEKPEVKIAGAKALMKLGTRNMAKVFWEELKRPGLDIETRLICALALGSCGEQKYRDILAPDLESANFTKSLVSALALGVMGEQRAKPILIKALEHGFPDIRRYAIMGLEGISGQEILMALAETANDDPDHIVRILCAAGLVAAGITDYRVVLWNELDNKQEDIRSEAVMALGRSMDQDTAKQLKWYLRREPSVPVRQTIQRVFREWEKSGRD